MAISSPNVIGTGGGGGGSQFAQLMAVAAQGVATAANLKHQREILAEEQRQYDMKVTQSIAQDPAAFAILARHQPHLARGLLEGLRVDPTKTEEALKQMASLGNLNPQQQATYGMQILNYLGIDARTGQQVAEVGSDRHRGGAPAMGPGQAMEQAGIDPGFAASQRGAVPFREPEETQQARESLFGTVNAFAPASETGVGGALQAGQDPAQADRQVFEGMQQAESGFAIAAVQQAFIDNPRDARAATAAVQPSMIWTDASREGIPAFQRAVRGAGLSEITGHGDHTRFNDIQNLLRQNPPNYREANKILPHPDRILSGEGSSAHRDALRRMGFANENGHIGPDEVRNYAAFRAMTMHKARSGDSGGQISTLSDDEMRSRFFWALDDRLTTADIGRLNNIDVNDEHGNWSEELTLNARREEFAKIISGKQGVAEFGQMMDQVGFMDMSAIRFRDALGQPSYQRWANHLDNYVERVMNSDFGMNKGHVRAAANEIAAAGEELTGFFAGARTPEQINQRADEFTRMFNATVQNFPGGLEGVKQHTNGGYSLEAEVVSMISNTLENDAQRALAEAGLTLDAMQSAMLAWQATLPDGDRVKESTDLAMRYLTDSGYFELSEADRIKRAERDPHVGTSLDALAMGWGIMTGMPLRPADWTNHRWILPDTRWQGVGTQPLRTQIGQPGAREGGTNRATDFVNNLTGGR